MSRLGHSQLRWFVAVMMAAVLPVCCCNGNMLWRSIESLGVFHQHTDQHPMSGEDMAAADTMTGMAGSMAEHAVNQSHDDACCTNADDEGSVPCHDDGACQCLQSRSAMTVPDTPPSLDGPAVVCATLDATHITPASTPTLWAVLHTVPIRIAQSGRTLLSLLCALTL